MVAILSVGRMLWSEISIEAEAGVPQWLFILRSMLALVSLGTGEVELACESLLGISSFEGDGVDLDNLGDFGRLLLLLLLLLPLPACAIN